MNRPDARMTGGLAAAVVLGAAVAFVWCSSVGRTVIVPALIHFRLYHEPYSHGLNDYTAHGVFATLHYRWP
jgi:hypothetical protein